MVELTQIQKKVYEFILTQIEFTGTPPTLREISAQFNWKAVGSAQDVVAALRKKGVLLNNTTSKARQIIPTLKDVKNHDSFMQVPLLGLVQAGLPREAMEQPQEWISFPTTLKKNHREDSYFALVIEGYSMVKAGFLPGDTILVESIQTARDKEIVVANVNFSEVTVKRFAQKGSSFYHSIQKGLNTEISPPAFLVPENSDFSPIPFGNHEEDKLIGVVRSLYRKTIF